MKTIDLNGRWEICRAGEEKWMECNVPGSVMRLYRDAGLLPDPYKGLNEGYYYALADSDWRFRRSFEVNEDYEDYAGVFLTAEGLDTFADITLNGSFVASVENMFIEHRFNIRKLLRKGTNILEIYFHSPTKTAIKYAENVHSKVFSNVDPNRSLVRKAQYSFGWDWGPRLTDIGIWKPIYIELIKYDRICNPYVRTKLVGSPDANSEAEVTIGGDLLLGGAGYDCSINLKRNGEIKGKASCGVSDGRFEAVLHIDSPDLWYPNGYGAADMCEAEINIISNDHEIDSLEFEVGLRTVELIREKDAAGESFFFKVNGEYIFAKGANWIPADSFLSCADDERYKSLISDAVAAGMNMLRVWGGGIYEKGIFYDLCDKYGIMVWQDFMFACATYPDEIPEYRERIKEEAQQVIKSLRHHTSLVIWCGNNEVNWGCRDWWNLGDPEFQGNKVFKEILPEQCALFDPDRPYWVSSPYGGNHPNSQTDGDRHSWDVWSGRRDYYEYEYDSGRFISEFGFQAMPCMKTVMYYTEGRDLKIESPVIRAHNKFCEGTEVLKTYISRNIGCVGNLHELVYKSQYLQAEAIKFGVEYWRMLKPHTSGTLFWQLNDCWPVASWSCIDYFGRKKALYYYSKRFFNPILTRISESSGLITVSIVNDLPQRKELTLKVSLYKTYGRKIGEKTYKFTLESNSPAQSISFSAGESGLQPEKALYPVDGPCTVFSKERDVSLLDCVLFAELKDNTGKTVHTNYHLFDKFCNVPLKKPLISRVQNGKQLILTADVPAFGVFIEADNDVQPDDNCLNMEPGREYIINFDGEPGNISLFEL